jgi:TetR/AcrR family transcriptional regulator, cholesterol catabolism regulator
VATLHMVFSGATMHSRSTPGGYRQVADQLDRAVLMVMNSRIIKPVNDLSPSGQ